MDRETEKALRQRVLAAFDRETFKGFTRLTPARVVWTFAHIWVGIAVAGSLGYWAWTQPGWLPKLLIPWLVLYLGTRLNAFAVQVHEAGHKLLFDDARVNDAFCNVFGAYWILNDVESYRRMHLVHHTDLHLETDPDLDLYRLPRGEKGFEIASTLIRDLLWITALRRIAAYVAHPKSQAHAKNMRQRMHLVAKLGSQLILVSGSVALLGWIQGPLFYLVFWVIPLFSVFPAIIRLRIVTEHFSEEHYLSAEKPFVSRSTSTSKIEDYLFGCDMQFHFEHHLLPMIPHARLAKLHRALLAKGFFQDLPPENDYLSSGYLRFWWRLLRGQVQNDTLSA